MVILVLCPFPPCPRSRGWVCPRPDPVCPLCAQLAAVHLVDSHYCTDPGKFISVLCTSLSTMLHVELPHVNVLSKMDLIEQYGKLGEGSRNLSALGEQGPSSSSLLPPCHGRTPFTIRGAQSSILTQGIWGGGCGTELWEFGGWETAADLRVLFSPQLAFRAPCFPAAFNLDYYTEVLDLSYLVDHLASDPFFRNFRRLNEKLVEVIEDYSLVSFVPLNVQVSQQQGTGSSACAELLFVCPEPQGWNPQL